MRRLAAIGMGLVVAVSACGGGGADRADPSGFVTDDQVKASDKTSSTSTGSGSTTTAPEKLTFCEAWTRSQALDAGSTSALPDFERIQRAIETVRDAAAPKLRGELEAVLSDLERLRVIGQRYSWRFDDTTKVSEEDAAAIEEISTHLDRFGTDSTVAKAAAEQCG